MLSLLGYLLDRVSIIIFFYIIVFETFKRDIQKGGDGLHLLFINPNISALSSAAVSLAREASVWIESEIESFFF